MAASISGLSLMQRARCAWTTDADVRFDAHHTAPARITAQASTTDLLDETCRRLRQANSSKLRRSPRLYKAAVEARVAAAQSKVRSSLHAVVYESPAHCLLICDAYG